MYKKYYSRFLKENKNKQHFACHSHHYWPDVTRQAMLDYWDDSAKYVDNKWEHIFSSKLPSAQKLIAETLNLDSPDQIAFAANTHEFVYRLLSCLPRNKKKTILTTDSEFYSFDRQINRLDELEEFEIEKIPTLPFSGFKERFLEKLKSSKYDLVFISQVYFNSGLALDFLDEIYSSTTKETILVLDGYHAFMALPTDLSKYQDRLFYTAGSYKYAQGGEGCCFLYVPLGCELRPEYTGWFAEFGELSEKKDSEVGYCKNGMRFSGATMDYAALYRLVSVLEMFKKDQVSVSNIHKHIQNNQKYFLDLISKINHKYINLNNLIVDDIDHHGHFLTFKFEESEVQVVAKQLKESGIETDFRGDRLRFGFGMYHSLDYDLSALDS